MFRAIWSRLIALKRIRVLEYSSVQSFRTSDVRMTQDQDSRGTGRVQTWEIRLEGGRRHAVRPSGIWKRDVQSS